MHLSFNPSVLAATRKSSLQFSAEKGPLPTDQSQKTQPVKNLLDPAYVQQRIQTERLYVGIATASLERQLQQKGLDTLVVTDGIGIADGRGPLITVGLASQANISGVQNIVKTNEAEVLANGYAFAESLLPSQKYILENDLLPGWTGNPLRSGQSYSKTGQSVGRFNGIEVRVQVLN